MTKTLMILALLFSASAASAATFPYFGSYICNPSGCFQYSLVPPRGYGYANVSAVMDCASGQECFAAAGGYVSGCSLAKSIQAYASYGPDATYLQYDPNRGGYMLVYAQDLRVTAELYTSGFSGWARTFVVYQHSDCYLGVTKEVKPLGGSGTGSC